MIGRLATMALAWTLWAAYMTALSLPFVALALLLRGLARRVR